MDRVNKNFDWASFVLGILFVILGCVSMYHVDTTLRFVSILFGIGAILKGIYEIWLRQTVDNLLNHKSVWLIVMAILDIILGIIFLFFHSVGALTIAYVFAIWFIIDCFGQLQVASFYREFRKGYYWLLVVLNVIGIVLGIVLLFNPMLSAIMLVWLIATFLILIGVLAIVASF
ncbi:MAG: DUF308 domain-containing protein [Limosilactobacillus coleohominis]|uniref:HdeD family acid-resistance protein n=1 Tax=Limosilactobacillus coleohominis TaxID=181675 RepID=UPI002A8201C7|nr:DUF308 domain-containing protein [Limosilactobacillus coleohominis]MCI5812872.1 DUF308 domain-containing protein [Lactobacillus sp.]MDY3702335.1 DUF308 domain-containing protein [Limosilactobacillus coleohominis]MDY5628355.1 DUF308 domain-containing protein [Limosilactobacillus coleohominis]